MSLRNFFKKKGKRLAGTWGRINDRRDMRAASKGIRRFRTEQEKLVRQPTIEEMLECDEIPECEHRHIEYHPYVPGTRETPEEPEGYYCNDCDTWLDWMLDEATRLGI